MCRRGKLHSALKFLEKAVKLEDGLIDLDDPASTHLNLCATLSEMNRHDKAARHADLALRSLLEKLNVPADVSPDEIPEEQKELMCNRPVRIKLRAVTLNNMGCLYRRCA